MTVIDKIRLLHSHLGLNDDGVSQKVQPLTNIYHTSSVHESQAGRLLRQIEDKLGLTRSINMPRLLLGARLKLVEKAMEGRPTHAPFAVGDRVQYIGTIVPRLSGRSGIIVRPDAHVHNAWMVRLDGDHTDRFFSSSVLKREKSTMTIVSRVVAAMSAFVGVSKPTNVEQAASELCAATKIASEGERLKKRAKEALQTLGVTLPEYRPGTVLAYESSTFRIEAITKEPSERLDEQALKDELNRCGLSRATIDRAFVAARRQNKPATSIVVTEK